MGGNGKHRWKISFYHRSPSAHKPQDSQPPKEFLCPISGSLMFDPVVVSSGQTFDRVSVQVCRDLGFEPTLDDASQPDFSAVIPNLAFKSTILSWCDTHHVDPSKPADYASVEKLVRASMVGSGRSVSEPQIRVSERELLDGIADKPPLLYNHATTELRPKVNHFYSSSSEESVVIRTSPPTPLHLATRPSCYSSSSSSSEITQNDARLLNPVSPTPEEDEFVARLKSSEVFEQEDALISLRKITRTNEATRISICTPRLLAALRPLLVSRYNVVQTNAVATLVNLSLEKPNKVKIVRSGFVPPIIDVLKGGFSESQEHAAGALFSLALEDDNKMAIGVLGALQPLMHALRAESERTRHDSALALYHLTLVQSNRVKLIKLGAVPTLMAMVKTADLASRVLLVLCNLAASVEGRSAMLDGNAVACLVGMLRSGELESESAKENCVAALYALSHGSLRFKGLAKEARAVEVLREVEERGSERAREKAKRILQTMKGRDGGGGGDGEEADWEGILESSGGGGGLTRSRYRFGPNSTNF